MEWPRKVVAIDFETTGLVPQYDSPLSLDAVIFEDGEPTGEALSLKILPSMKAKFSLEAWNVQTGIEDKLDIDAMTKSLMKMFPEDAVSAREAMAQVVEWCRDTGAHDIPNVAQRASFDWGFYHEKLEAFTSVKGCGFSPWWICTKTLARRVFPDIKPKETSLNALSIALGLGGRTAQGHDSKEDAILCGRIYFALLKEVSRMEVATVALTEEMVKWQS